MTTIPPYRTSAITTDYIVLVNLAKISGIERFVNENSDAIRNALLNISSYTPAVQRLIPLVYGNTKKFDLFDQLPNQIKCYLHDTTLKLVAYECIKYDWLTKIITLFNNNDIPLILLKGSAFNGNLYPNETLRAGSDIDILIKQSDYNRACEVLDNNNYLQQYNSRPGVYDTLFESSYKPKMANGVVIDLHKSLTHPALFHIDENEIWEASNPHPAYNTGQVRILSPEHTLLHLAVHAFRDYNFCTHNLLDTHEVVYQSKPDEKLLINYAKSWGACHILYCLLKNCQIAMDSPIDRNTLLNLKPCIVKDTLSKFVLKSHTTADQREKTMKHRIAQVLGLTLFPDNLYQGFRLTRDYLSARLDRSNKQ